MDIRINKILYIFMISSLVGTFQIQGMKDTELTQNELELIEQRIREREEREEANFRSAEQTFIRGDKERLLLLEQAQSEYERALEQVKLALAQYQDARKQYELTESQLHNAWEQSERISKDFWGDADTTREQYKLVKEQAEHALKNQIHAREEVEYTRERIEPIRKQIERAKRRLEYERGQFENRKKQYENASRKEGLRRDIERNFKWEKNKMKEEEARRVYVKI